MKYLWHHFNKLLRNTFRSVVKCELNEACKYTKRKLKYVPFLNLSFSLLSVNPRQYKKYNNYLTND